MVTTISGFKFGIRRRFCFLRLVRLELYLCIHILYYQSAQNVPKASIQGKAYNKWAGVLQLVSSVTFAFILDLSDQRLGFCYYNYIRWIIGEIVIGFKGEA